MGASAGGGGGAAMARLNLQAADASTRRLRVAAGAMVPDNYAWAIWRGRALPI